MNLRASNWYSWAAQPFRFSSSDKLETLFDQRSAPNLQSNIALSDFIEHFSQAFRDQISYT